MYPFKNEFFFLSPSLEKGWAGDKEVPHSPWDETHRGTAATEELVH